MLDIVSLMHKSESETVRIGQCFMDLEHKRVNKPYSINVQYLDQSFKLLDPTPEADSKVKSTVYPPPQAENIDVVRFCSVLR